MFKLSSIETTSKLAIVDDVARLLQDLEFEIKIGASNSSQITNDIDSRISRKLGESYQLITNQQDLEVDANGNSIGEIDIAIRIPKDGVIVYIEVEKSNKKTIWFDYIKLLTKIKNDPKRIGIVICPKNYAHKIGTWNLYHDAISYLSHLVRLSNNKNIDRIGVIGYTQFAFLEGEWQAFSPGIIQKLKAS